MGEHLGKTKCYLYSMGSQAGMLVINRFFHLIVGGMSLTWLKELKVKVIWIAIEFVLLSNLILKKQWLDKWTGILRLL